LIISLYSLEFSSQDQQKHTESKKSMRKTYTVPYNIILHFALFYSIMFIIYTVSRKRGHSILGITLTNLDTVS